MWHWLVSICLENTYWSLILNNTIIKPVLMLSSCRQYYKQSLVVTYKTTFLTCIQQPPAFKGKHCVFLCEWFVKYYLTTNSLVHLNGRQWVFLHFYFILADVRQGYKTNVKIPEHSLHSDKLSCMIKIKVIQEGSQTIYD